MSAQSRPIADDELFITRVFDAPVSLVFHIWEHREHAIKWWGPKEFTTTHMEMDFRVGGAYRACIVSERYGENWMGGIYREIERDKRIVFTFAWENEGGKPGVETLVTITFREENGKTIQTFHQSPFLTVVSRDNHVGGWNSFFDREQAYAEKLAAEGQS